MAHAKNQVNGASTAMALQAIDKTIADVTAQDDASTAAKLDALRRLRERVAAQQTKPTHEHR